MTLINSADYGLIVWGTKRGMKPFFSLNLEASESHANLDRQDIRSYFNFTIPGLVFYSIEHKPGYSGFNIFRTVPDALGRPGFYAITLLMAADRAFSQNNVLELLTTLCDVYRKNYISEGPNGQISETATEDTSLFQAIISGEQLHYEEADSPAQLGDKNCIVTWSGPQELSEIFANYRRSELMAFNQTFLLPADETNLRCSLEKIKLPDLPPSYNLILLLNDYSSNVSIIDASVEYRKNGKLIESLDIVPEDGRFLKGAITASDSITISIQKEGYKSRVIDSSYIQKEISRTRSNNSQVYLPISLAKEIQSIVIGDPEKSNGNQENNSNKGAISGAASPKSHILLKFRRLFDNYKYPAFATALLLLVFIMWLIRSRLDSHSVVKPDPSPVTQPDPPKKNEVYDYHTDSISLKKAYDKYLAKGDYDKAIEDFKKVNRQVDSASKQNIPSSWQILYRRITSITDSIHQERAEITRQERIRREIDAENRRQLEEKQKSSQAADAREGKATMPSAQEQAFIARMDKVLGNNVKYDKKLKEYQSLLTDGVKSSDNSTVRAKLNMLAGQVKKTH